MNQLYQSELQGVREYKPYQFELQGVKEYIFPYTPLHLAVQIGKVDSFFRTFSLLGLQFTSLALVQSFSSNGRAFFFLQLT